MTSPPYATALPYVDTDRLSLLAILGHRSRVRSGLERNLTGSREIRRTARAAAETALCSASASDSLPAGVVQALRRIHRANRRCDVGCRRENMAALLWRYFVDMRDNLVQTRRVLAPGHRAFYVVGNGRTKAGERWVIIDTCRHLAEIGHMAGLRYVESIGIDVTTENRMHIRNAITRNNILVFEKSG